MNHVVVCWLIVTQLLICIKYGACTISPCCGENWIAFEDQCFKLIEKQVTREVAEMLCTDDNAMVPTLASITSAAEQTFLTKFVFETSGVENNIWIGAKLIQNVNIVWDDGSLHEFTNWAEGSPSEQLGHDCVEMQWYNTKKSTSNDSDSNLQSINGKWRDVKCGEENYALCKKTQSWSCYQLRQEIQDIRNELTVFRKESEDILEGLQSKLDDLQRNPVPIGFIYVQLSNQPEPSCLWPQTQWDNISSTYAGLFFRVLGGTSAAFGQTQNENSPRISEIQNVVANGQHHINVAANGDWTLPLWTGSDSYCLTGTNTCYWSTMYRQSAGEVRPRNQAIQIWKRIQ